VIIETPWHNRPLALMRHDELELVVETYHRRYSDLIADSRVMMATLFMNHGERAGTSLIHPHAQIIATSIVPRHIRHMEREALQYFDEWGRCVHCDILEHEIKCGERIVAENAHFVSFVPYAAEVPFELWIYPRRHTPDFGLLRDEEKGGLADILRDGLARLYHRLGDPDFNFVVNTSVPPKTGTKRYHWHLQIRPRLTTVAGFEIGSGIHVNPSVPESDAAFLRDGQSAPGDVA
jgi:UDPglucose--hexose-1-phosphate uridylyltransferase